MAVLLDTSSLPAPERAEAVRSALEGAVSRARVWAPPDASSRIERWDLEAGAHVIHHVSRGHRLTRTRQHLASDTTERISVGVATRGSMLLRHRDLVRADEVGELQLIDLTSPYDLLVDGESSVHAVTIDYCLLGLSVDAVRKAVPLIPKSPLYSLVRRHLLELPGAVDSLPAGPALGMLGTSTTELVRALIASVGDADDATGAEVLHQSLFVRLTAFIQQHQREADLSAGRLAKEFGVSTRSVYTAFARNDESLAEWVMRGRLEGCRRDLASLAHDRGAVNRVSASWGFKDARHFARRFRAQYGLSPREWQSLCATSIESTPTPASSPRVSTS
ncbi:helix-turn-helix domain-containing protein [Kineococcus sp. SYSU DK005]|uniref:helix-turn-helix domain-containing protein n=1 Tax=Kineococcus sp. SYSU DK005 TaxID=3383126 RepID=UPI003D7C9AE2